MARSTKANAKKRVSISQQRSPRISTQASLVLMQKHARVSKIAYIFQTRNEWWVRGNRGGGGRLEYFLFRAWRASSSLSGALEEQQRRGTDNGSGADAHYDDWQIQLTADRAPPRRGRLGLTLAKYY